MFNNYYVSTNQLQLWQEEEEEVSAPGVQPTNTEKKCGPISSPEVGLDSSNYGMYQTDICQTPGYGSPLWPLQLLSAEQAHGLVLSHCLGKKKSTNAKFITLTYDDKHQPLIEDPEPGDPYRVRGTLRKKDLQDFFKRFRKHHQANRRVSDKGIRYYAVGEYGGNTERPHYHAIVFNASVSTIENLSSIWGNGQIHVGRVTPASIGYVAGYTINRPHVIGTRAQSFNAMSRRPGIGADYLRANGHVHNPLYDHRTGRVGQVAVGKGERQQIWCLRDGSHTKRLPRYYKDKIFTKEDKEANTQKWLQERSELYESIVGALKGHHAHPGEYYELMRQEAHDLIARKHKKNRTL